MPIVNIKPSATQMSFDPARARAVMRKVTGTITNLVTDSLGSKYWLCDLPSECVLDLGTQFKVDLWGYVDIRIGTFATPGALVSVLRSAGAIHVLRTTGDTRHNKALWEQVGLAADPGGMIGIWVHGSVANAAAAGSMNFDIQYLWRH